MITLRKKFYITTFVFMLITVLFPITMTLSARTINPAVIEAGYYGEQAKHPGVTLGIGVVLLQNEWYQLTPTVRLGWYIHPQDHQSLFIETGIRQKATLPSGLFAEVTGAVGFLISRPHRKAQINNKTKPLVNKPLSWSPKFMVSAYGGVGWLLLDNFDIPLEPYINVGTFLETSFNSSWTSHTVLDTGVRNYILGVK
jgi:hypothetical protein